jgi:hypothetical protein
VVEPLLHPLLTQLVAYFLFSTFPARHPDLTLTDPPVEVFLCVFGLVAGTPEGHLLVKTFLVFADRFCLLGLLRKLGEEESVVHGLGKRRTDNYCSPPDLRETATLTLSDSASSV